MSSTQIEIDDNPNVTDQVSLLQPPIKCVSGRFNGGPRNNTGFKGVSSKNKKERRHSALLHSIDHQRKDTSVQGRYKTPIEAARAFDLHCCAIGRPAQYCNFPEDYAKLKEQKSEIIQQLSKQLMSRRNKLGNKAKRGSRSSSSSNVSSATTSEDDADEVTHYRVETNNIGASSNKKDHDNDLDVEDDIVSCYSAMVSKEQKLARVKTWMVYRMTWCSSLNPCVATKKMETNT